MALAFDAASEFNPAAATTGETWAHTVGSGSNRILLVWVGRTGVAGITVTVSSDLDGALTRLDGEEDAADASIELWYKKAPTVGAHNVTVTPSASARIHGGAVSYTGVDQTTPFGTVAKANSNNVASLNATVDVTSATGELVVGAVGRRGNETGTPGTGTTERVSSFNTAGTDPGATSAGDEAGAATVTINWTWTVTSRRWAILGVPLKPAAAGGAVALDGTSAGTSTDTGALNATFGLGATSAGTSSTTGSAAVTFALGGTSAGTSSTTGSVAVTWALTGTSAGTSTTTGDLTVTSGGQVALTGTSAGTSSTSGSLRVTFALAGTSAGSSTTTGNLAAGRWQPSTDSRWNVDSENRWPVSAETRW